MLLIKLGLLEKAASLAISTGSSLTVRAVKAEALKQRNEPVVAACASFLDSHS